MDVLGPSLEKTTIWPKMAPFLASLDSLVEAVKTNTPRQLGKAFIFCIRSIALNVLCDIVMDLRSQGSRFEAQP